MDLVELLPPWLSTFHPGFKELTGQERHLPSVTRVPPQCHSGVFQGELLLEDYVRGEIWDGNCLTMLCVDGKEELGVGFCGQGVAELSGGEEQVNVVSFETLTIQECPMI
jgi:hypothetical protein